MIDTPQKKLGYLSSMEVFRDLSPEEVEAMGQQTTMATCKPGKIFYMPEDVGEVLFLLKKGRVQLYRISPSGKKLVVVTLGPGAVFGEMALVGQRMHHTFAEAMDECLICVMSRADVERLLRDKPVVAFRLLESLGQRLLHVETRLEEIAFKSIPARLAGLLLRLAEKGEAGIEVRGYTHQDLGEMLGTYRETTTQTLNDFKAQGLIEIGRKRIRLLDTEGLATLTEA
jgi:CRP-like cAMP-binding protein